MLKYGYYDVKREITSGIYFDTRRHVTLTETAFKVVVGKEPLPFILVQFVPIVTDSFILNLLYSDMFCIPGVTCDIINGGNRGLNWLQ